MISYSPSKGCIRSTLIVRTLWHQSFTRCHSASFLKQALKKRFVWILSGDTVSYTLPYRCHWFDQSNPNFPVRVFSSQVVVTLDRNITQHYLYSDSDSPLVWMLRFPGKLKRSKLGLLAEIRCPKVKSSFSRQKRDEWNNTKHALMFSMSWNAHIHCSSAWKRCHPS